MPRPKYHNHRTAQGDSKMEIARWKQLKLMEDSGEIYDLNRQVPFELIPSTELLRPVFKHGKMRKREYAVKYIADFVYYTADGIQVVEDVKGFETPDYVIKRKLMLYLKGIQIREIRKEDIR